MRRAVDTNVLVYAHIASLPDHDRVRAFMLDFLSDPANALAITPMILHEFVHVITDGRRFERPVSMPEALAVSRGYLGRSNVECLSIDEEVMRRTLDLLAQHRLGRRRIADTLLAATLIHHGVTELVTCDPDDFKAFSEITVVDPRA